MERNKKRPRGPVLNPICTPDVMVDMCIEALNRLSSRVADRPNKQNENVGKQR